MAMRRRNSQVRIETAMMERTMAMIMVVVLGVLAGCRKTPQRKGMEKAALTSRATVSDD